MHTYIHACIQSCIHTYVRTYMQTYAYTHTFACISTHSFCVCKCICSASGLRVYRRERGLPKALNIRKSPEANVDVDIDTLLKYGRVLQSHEVPVSKLGYLPELKLFGSFGELEFLQDGCYPTPAQSVGLVIVPVPVWS